MKKVLFTACSLSDSEIASLKENSIEIVKADGDLSESELIKQLQSCNGYICGGSDKATKNVIEQTNLEIIIFYGTGYENYVDVETATRKGIIVANTPKANAYTVAEYAVALILDSVKKIASNNSKTKSGLWERGRVWTLKDRTLGIIGMGTIGTYVATILKNAFNMRVLYVSRSRKEEAEKNLKAEKVSLQELMKRSDVITVHASYSKEAENMIGEAELNVMQPHAVLVNATRAELVDGVALYNALKDEKLATAAFDAYYIEPAPKPSEDKWKLLSLPDDKFIITPHTAYNSKEAFEAMNNMVVENLLSFVKGDALPYKVN